MDGVFQYQSLTHRQRRLKMRNGKAVALCACFLLLLSFPVAIQAETVTLKFSDQNSDVGWGPTHATQPWVKKVEEATKGQVKIQIYPNQTLAKGKQNWQAAKRGIADMSWNVMPYYAGLTPYAEVITLPGLPFKTAEEGSEIIWKLFENYPEVNKQFAENTVLILYTSDPFLVITSKKQIKTLEDFKGMKLRVVGGAMVDAVKAYGGIPMFIPMPDNYIAMQKGTVDGVCGTWEAIQAFRLHEVGRYVTVNIPLGASYFAVVMNNKKWASLSKNIQDAIMSVSGLKGSIWFGKNFFDSAKEEVPKVAKKGGYDLTVYSLPDDERERYIEVGGKPVWDAWVERMEGKGYKSARKILDAAFEIAK
jgi:TRAP-type C4-dicarboxylate transport system substrate-binding protein